MSIDLEDDALVILLEDLLPDARGEVVLVAEENVPLNIITDAPVAESGVVEEHVTATGVDVHGLHFYSFDNGITLYSEHDILITHDSMG